MLRSWAPVQLPVQSEPWGRGVQRASSSLSTIPWLPFLPRRPHCQNHQVSYGKPGVPAALGPAGTHPPSLTVHPAPARSPVLLGGVTFTNTSTLKEPQSLVEYLGLQLVRQEGVSNTGNAHPIGSGWLRTAPLPSARKESASATLPPHMVTYNTSGFSFPLLSSMCLIF